MKGIFNWLIPIVIGFFSFVLDTSVLSAHCDTMDGPVVSAAQKALETGDINLVLIWVQKADEAEIKQAFSKTLEVRELNSAARDLADKYFFETLVRIHRAGEGAPFTGLKPADLDLGPAIPAADKSLETGSLKELHHLISEKVEEGLHNSFHRALHAKEYKSGDLEAGREFIEAYVLYVHYVERLYDSAANPIHGHSTEPEESESHSEQHSDH